MFLFIYFLAPKNVFAAIETVCCYSTSNGNVQAKMSVQPDKNNSAKLTEITRWQTKKLTTPPTSEFTGLQSGVTLKQGACPGRYLMLRKWKDLGWFGTGFMSQGVRGSWRLFDTKSEAQSVQNDLNRNSDSREEQELAILAYDENCSFTSGKSDSMPSSTEIDNSTVEGGIVKGEQSSTDDAIKAQGDDSEPKKVKDYKQRIKYESENQRCEDILGDVNNSKHVAWLLQKILNYIRIFGILLVLVFSGLEFSKVILSNDYDALKKAQQKTIYRVGGIVALLLLPALVNFLLGLFISGSFDLSCGIR